MSLIEFNQLPNEAKIWVFVSSRKFYTKEIEAINLFIDTFLNLWTSNGKIIESAYLIKHNRFIIVGANTNKLNLSFDAHEQLTLAIQKLEQKFEVSLLDKINVCFKQGEFVQFKTVEEFKKLSKNKGVSKKTIVFNPFINFKEELDYNWEIPLENSWIYYQIK